MLIKRRKKKRKRKERVEPIKTNGIFGRRQIRYFLTLMFSH